jgi:UTP:GlnB (protein PII) uridylyltransferase
MLTHRVAGWDRVFTDTARGTGYEGRGAGGGAAPPVPAAAIRAFVRSMPTRYRELFDATAQAEHTAIALRAAAHAAHVEVWRRPGNGVSVLAVVAEEQPGLLARVSATFAGHDVDVVAAHAFRRAVSRKDDAFALFWIRNAIDCGAGIDDSVVTSMGEVLDRSARETLSIEALIARIARSRDAGARGDARVTFEETADGTTLLVAEAWDRRGLLLAMARTLFVEHVHIVRSEVRTVAGRALNRFEVTEMDGRALTDARKTRVGSKLVAALDGALSEPQSSR